MKTILCAAVFALSLGNAAGQASYQRSANQPSADFRNRAGKGHGQSTHKMPDGQVCRSSMKGKF